MTYETTLQKIVSADERYVILTAENRAAIRNLPHQIGQRFIDTGITEQTMIGVAAGLALRGRIPIVHALAAFLSMRAFEFIRTDVGLPHLPVKLVGGVPGFLSEANGPTHQALEDVALMRGIPGMGIFCPADEQELGLGLPHILADERPFYIRFNASPPAIEHSTPFQIGRAEQIGDGEDITILVCGMLLKQALEAKIVLEEAGHGVRILNLRTVKPIDEAAITRAAQQTRLLVTLEDHFLTGGLYTILCEHLVKHHILSLVCPIALDNRWFKPALLSDLLAYEGFKGGQIAQKITAYAASKGLNLK